MNLKFRSFFGVSLSVCLMAISASAQTNTNRYAGPRWSLLDAKSELQASGNITLAKYPDCDDAVVDKKMVRVYRADGTGECQDETYLKVLTEKGKRNSRTISLGFQLPYETVEVTTLEVIKPDGQAIPVDIAANSKESIDEGQMSMNIYDPNSKILQVNLPQVEIGDTVHSVIRTLIQRSIIPGAYSETTLLEAPSYIRHSIYEIYSPTNDPLRHLIVRAEINGTLKHTSEKSTDTEVLDRWELANVPRMFNEPSMPPYEMVLQRLLVSTSPDWQSISKWYWDLSQSHLQSTNADMARAVTGLTRKSKTDAEKVEALFHYVSRDIRYMGLTPEKDRPGFEPHDVKITFGNKYGVCRDKAALLVSMLRMAGLKAYPVLMNVGCKLDPDVPDPGFNHAIVAVELSPREYELMDPTAENTKQLLPSYDCDQSFLVCRPEGDVLRTSKVFPPSENMMRITTEATLDRTGIVNAKAQLRFEGINDNEFRDAFSRMKPDEIRRFFESDLKPVLPGVTIKSLKLTPSDMADVSQSLRADLEFSAPGLTVTGGNAAVVNLPWIGKRFGIVGFILEGMGLEKRKYPLRTEIACGLEEQVSLKLDKELSHLLSLPHCEPIDNPGLSYQRTFNRTNGILTGTTELDLKKVSFSPAEYLQLKQNLKSMDYDQRKSSIFATSGATEEKPLHLAEKSEPTPVDSNSEILESTKSLEIKDAHTSTYRIKYVKRILTYGGKKTEAEVKLPYNPASQDVKLLHATVTSKTGVRQEISPGEINVMDASWNAGARRYTGGKTFVANLPGVDIGSVIEVELEITSKNKPYLAGFEQFQLFDDLVKKSFTLTIPTNVAFQKLVTGKAGLVTESDIITNAVRTYIWRSEKVSAMPNEHERPPEWIFAPGVEFFAGDLSNYVTELNTTLLDRSAKNTNVLKLAKQLTAHASNDLAAVIAIRDFVAKSIRSAGPSFTDLPLSELSAADVVLADGYGHAADQAILLHSLLQAAELKPEFVLASSLPPISAITNVALAFPFPHYFSSPLVRVAVAGETYYLNDSDQYARLGATAFDGKLAIALNTGAFEVIHAARDCETRTETDYTLAPSADGKARIGITHRYYGTVFGSQNRFFSELPPEERDRYFQQAVSEVAQGARPVGGLVTKFDVYPAIEQFTVDVDDYCVADGNYFYFDLPYSPSLIPAGADQRTLPLYISWQSASTVRTEIDLPAGYQQVVISPPAEKLKVPDDGGYVAVTSENSNGKFVVTDELVVSPAVVSAKQYPEILDLEATLGRKSSRMFMLEKK